MQRKATNVGSALLGLVLTSCATATLLPWKGDPAFLLTPDARTLHLIVELPMCPPPLSSVGRVVEYRAEEVAVSLRIYNVSDTPCLIAGGLEPIEVQLSQPLGNRRIVSLDQPPPPFPSPVRAASPPPSPSPTICVARPRPQAMCLDASTTIGQTAALNRIRGR